MCFGQVDWFVLVVCVWSCVLVITSIHRGCDCEDITCPTYDCQAHMVGWTIVHIPTEGVIATIRIHVMMWGNSLLVRGKASFGLE